MIAVLLPYVEENQEIECLYRQPERENRAGIRICNYKGYPVCTKKIHRKKSNERKYRNREQKRIVCVEPHAKNDRLTLSSERGRIVRGEDQNKHVKIFRYVAKGIFDTYLEELKQKFIGQRVNSLFVLWNIWMQQLYLTQKSRYCYRRSKEKKKRWILTFRLSNLKC